MRHNRLLPMSLTLAAGMTLAGCSLLDSLLKLTQLDILSVIPLDGFANANADEAGAVVFALGARDDQGFSIAPPLSLLTFEDDAGEPIDIEEGEEVPGSDAGTFVLLVDGSASMVGTDPSRFRAEAAGVVAERIGACSDHWDQALLEFTTDASAGKYRHSRMLADFGSKPDRIAAAAEELNASGGTPLWDATLEVLGGLSDHAEDHEAALESAMAGLEDTGAAPDPEQGEEPASGEEPNPETDPGYTHYGRSLVVISDGADTASSARIEQVLLQAQEAGIHVHTIGLGPASDAETEFMPESQAIADLRRLALETGGTYGYVSSADQLPTQADAIARAVCGGYTELTVRFAEPKPRGERVNGRVSLLNTGIGVPFSFTAP